MADLQCLTVTARTACFAYSASDNLYALKDTVSWSLFDGESALVQQGETDNVVFMLSNLEPDRDYNLRVGDAECAFATPVESALFDIADYGARCDAEDNAAAIQTAINALPDHGTLRVPAGDWPCGPLFLKSRMTLLLEKNARLMGIADRSRYAILPARDDKARVLGTWEGVAEACFASLITAVDCTDLAITGEGVIDGGGDRGDWWTWPKETRDGARRPRTVFISHCERVTLSGITVCNSPSWTIHPVLSRAISAFGIFVRNDPFSPNTDGFDPECCVDVSLKGVFFSVGDDCIAIKAGKRDPKGGLDQVCENISIENCRMERGHGGVVIGSEMSGSVRNVTVRRCSLSETDRGLRIKTRRGRGGVVENIVMEDCVMDAVLTPLAINAFYFCDADGKSDAVQTRTPQPVTETTPHIANITVRNLVAHNVAVAAAAFFGLPEAPITGITLETIHITYDPEAVADVPVMACNIEPVRHGGIIAEYAQFDSQSGLVFGPSNRSLPESVAV
ncbi:glycoside hydrolase family 28 protein [Rhizobium oryziradicis]|uniref:polygalacturonase PglA n=1 Tax=Rhizobium oryziradicis TaxID=1867956 RepID=UPI0009F9A2C5|nr:glycoside hydrolase family 28 protein [Rhizobium oryziradicis]